jgi:hypothetical protein
VLLGDINTIKGRIKDVLRENELLMRDKSLLEAKSNELSAILDERSLNL